MQIEVLGILIPIIMGCVSAAKEMNLPSRLAPLLSILFGVGFVALLTHSFSGVNILVGIATGLAACGLYSGGKTLIKG